MQRFINESLVTISLSVLVLLSVSWKAVGNNIISVGKQPELSRDSKGVLRVVFGRNDSIFYSLSADKGKIFSIPILMGHVAKMHLGMTRGPQIASSVNYSLITAIDQAGAIHWFLLNHQNNKGINKGVVNDKKGSAPEGLMGIAADEKDHFYAVWLDIRLNKKNNIYFSSLLAPAEKWTSNTLVYQSPDDHTCECCKPTIAVKGAHVAIMFRNWVNGSRDMYAIQSLNEGKTFGAAEKLGKGTWKLDGCPMDGGGIVIDDNNIVHTTWQREGVVYYCKAGGTEVHTGKGRASAIATGNGKIICSYQEGQNLKINEIGENKEAVVGKGKFIKSILLDDKSILCVWEQDNKILFKKV